MTEVTSIHLGKQPFRRHYLAEWLVARNMTPPDLLAGLNDPERDMALTEVDKSQVYRWLKGQTPNQKMQRRIAAALEMEDPMQLFMHPDQDWFAAFISGRDQEEIERIKHTLMLAFPREMA